MSVAISSSHFAYLERFQGIGYFYFGIAAMLVYDHIIMIADEVNYVWGASGTLGKILYFFARYPPYIDAVLALIRLLVESPSLEWCQKTFFSVACMSNVVLFLRGAQRGAGAALVGIVIAEAILCMRTWALWNRDLRVGIPLLSFALCGLAAAIWVLHKSLSFTKYEEFGDQYTQPIGCPLPAGATINYFNFIIIALLETVVFILTLVAGFKHSFSIANIVIPLVAVSDMVHVFVSLQRAMHAICATRILLHVRQASKRRETQMLYSEVFTDSELNSEPLLDTLEMEARESSSAGTTFGGSAAGLL
ncbi:hypothetical protein NLI96_g6571 [Meripilus lineatus]|uniref:DUF6533 domain-containing protein n=1 Tax=Meripilus lineatus TaxID=2056292 RepID=A0AAD5V107_9APHY|nr:hypothetical protein NLI96_g6571 [Physisporinus lineatus]